METEQQKAALKSALIDEIKRHNGFRDERLYIFGYSYITQVLCETLYAHQVQVEAFLDNARDKIGTMHGDIPILAPASLPDAQNVYVLIHSAHAKEMIAQLKEIVPDIGARIINLEYPKKDSDGFWKETQYETSLRMLREGEEIYRRISAEDTHLVIGPMLSLGDYSLMELTLHQYLETYGITRYKVIVCGRGAQKTVALFHEQDIVMLSPDEMHRFLKYVMFVGEERCNAILAIMQYYATRHFFHLINGQELKCARMFPEFLFQIEEPYECRRPDIYAPVAETEMEALGMKKGRSVILSPYANTMNALPTTFWEALIAECKVCGMEVFTNASGSEQELPGTKRLDVPLNRMGTYMQYAGYFVSLRSGLNDITGRADCAQAVIYRKRYKTFNNEIEGAALADLQALDVAPNAVQLVFDEEDMSNTVTAVKRALGI